MGLKKRTQGSEREMIMKTTTRINFYPEGNTITRNGRFLAAYTNAEYQAQLLTGKGINSTDSTYTPHDAGNEIIELAERIKSERAIMAMRP